MEGSEEFYKQNILELIEKHLGKDDPIGVAEIMKKLPLTDREIRKVVQLLINDSGYPIGSTTKGPYGFFMIVSLEDYFEAVSNLMSRKDKLKERIKSLVKACKNEGLEVPEINIHNTKDKTIFNISNSVVINLK